MSNVSREIEERKKQMLIRALIITALAVSWSAPAWAQPRAIWLCAGARPSWSLHFSVDFASWVREKEAITYRGFTTLEPDEQRTGNRIWVYQLNEPEARGLRMTLVVQEHEQADCPYSKVSPQVPRFFTGMVITHSRVYIGCCRQNDEK
jgi:hypothetical protein